MKPSGRTLSAVADAQQARVVRPRSKVVMLPISGLPAFVNWAVKRHGVVTFVMRKYLPPLEAHSGNVRAAAGAQGGIGYVQHPQEGRSAPGEARREAAAGGPRSGSPRPSGAPIGEVGNSNTQLSGQLGQPTSPRGRVRS